MRMVMHMVTHMVACIDVRMGVRVRGWRSGMPVRGVQRLFSTPISTIASARAWSAQHTSYGNILVASARAWSVQHISYGNILVASARAWSVAHTCTSGCMDGSSDGGHNYIGPQLDPAITRWGHN